MVLLINNTIWRVVFKSNKHVPPLSSAMQGSAAQSPPHTEVNSHQSSTLGTVPSAPKRIDFVGKKGLRN